MYIHNNSSTYTLPFFTFNLETEEVSSSFFYNQRFNAMTLYCLISQDAKVSFCFQSVIINFEGINTDHNCVTKVV